jgi:hypothetical protein
MPTRKINFPLISALLLISLFSTELLQAQQTTGTFTNVVASGAYFDTGFIVRSYQGRSRCLDYTPETVGTPIFINDCNLAHPVVVQELADGKHTVILHAGTKVIAFPVFSTHTFDGTPFMASVGTPVSVLTERQLVLEDSAVITTFPNSVAFLLDGDSIILALNHDLVAQVQNARGTAGSPVVLGPRNLADNEFWDFVGGDGSDRGDPTSGFVRIGYPGDPACPDDNSCINRLYSVVPNAGPGTVVRLGRSLNVTGRPFLSVGAGVTIRGDRRGTAFGAELSRDFDGSKTLEDMFDVVGDDVRITGLRLRGPSRSTDSDQPNSTGVFVKPSLDANQQFAGEFLRVIVDHNDISNFTYGGVRVFDGLDRTDSCDPNSTNDPQTRPFNTRVVRNFIHHNERQSLGYGVEAEQGGFPLVEGNTFVANRHSIAGDGRANSGYKAQSNLVLSYAPVQHGFLDWPFHTEDFDMHGVGPDGFTGIGGDYVGIFGNTFLGTDRPNFELRGSICNFVDFKANISLQSKDDAVQLSWGPFCGGHCLSGTVQATFNISSDPPQFDYSNPTYRHGALGVGDFDGDGADDLFLATGAAWYYSPAGQSEWRFLSAKTDSIDHLLFGDFDGDGRTDVVTIQGSQIMVSWAGLSDWEELNSSPAPGSISDMAVGDFIGDQRPDIFFADGNLWWLSDGGRNQFVPINTSSFRVPNLRFGDFDGDGKTDVFGIVSGQWQYTKSALGGWMPLQNAKVGDINALIVADFNGDGHADVGANCEDPGCWRITYFGTEDWEYFSQPFGLTGPQFAGVGHFLGHAWTDVLSWNDFGICDSNTGQDTQLCMSVAGISTTKRYSNQDMR